MSEPLSPLQRLELIRLVHNLSSTDFGALKFALKPTGGVVPSIAAAQGDRAEALLIWVEGPTGCGLPVFLEVLEEIVPGKLPVTPFPLLPEPPVTEPPVTEPGFTVDLGGGVTLEMIYIFGGSFLMGSPEGEVGRWSAEGPQHKVVVPAFYIAKHLITQRQWLAVFLLDEGKRSLINNTSLFKGDELPVERVDWYGAAKFCQRLNQHTAQNYRLPSEAEWEYACRAGTSTPFSFGATLSTDLVNYDGRYTYGSGKRGHNREKTTPVGSFPANGFGLYDMHGNVWEWCEDHWHFNYEGAPKDGSAWLSDNESGSRVRRGGAWHKMPKDCRSARRDCSSPTDDRGGVGFRVVFAP